MKNKKSIYQNCPNCWGYQEYERTSKSDQKDIKNESHYSSTSIFRISGNNIDEGDLLYK